MPCDSLDEFYHKPIRNDYLLQALGELDINKLRVPTGDLTDKETLERIHVLKRLGYEFSIFSIGIPANSLRDLVFANKNLINAWEVTIPRKQIPEALEQLRDVKRGADISIYLSTLDTLDDQKQEEDYEFSHFPTHGFKLRESELLRTYVDRYDAAEAIHGFVFSVNAEMNISESIQKAEEMVQAMNMSGVVHLNMPRLTEAMPFVDDNQIAHVVCETLIAAMAVDNIDVFLDTLIDHDRGYFPRNGLMDRRYNPRPAYHCFRHLHRAVSGDRDKLIISDMKTDPGLKAFDIQSPDLHSVLVLPDTKLNVIELELTAGTATDRTYLKSMDLYTGRIKDTRVKALDKNKMVLEIDPKSNQPILVVVE